MFHRMVFLGEMSGDRSGLFRRKFLDTSMVFIHSVSEGYLGFTNVLVATFFTIYDVNQVSKFTGNFVFNWHVFAFKHLIRVKASNLINFLDSRTVGAFT